MSDANERFEALAAEFYRETGVMAPGKDDPLGTHTFEQRRDRWNAWWRERREREATPMDRA